MLSSLQKNPGWVLLSIEPMYMPGRRRACSIAFSTSNFSSPMVMCECEYTLFCLSVSLPTQAMKNNEGGFYSCAGAHESWITLHEDFT